VERTLFKEPRSNQQNKRVVTDDDNDDATHSLHKVSSITPKQKSAKPQNTNSTDKIFINFRKWYQHLNSALISKVYIYNYLIGII
jgi:hypothetical protein